MLFFHKTFFTVLTILALFAVGLAVPPHERVVVYASSDSAGESADAGSSEAGIVDASALRMRSCPDTSCSVIGVLQQGNTLLIEGEENDWLKVRHRDTQGWVYGGDGYVRRDVAASELEDARRRAMEMDQQLTETRDDVDRLEKRAASAQDELAGIEQDIAALRDSIGQIREEAAAIEERMEKTAREIEKTRGSIAEKRDYARQRLVALYKLNRLGAMNLLATAESTGDLFRRKAAIEAIVAHDGEVIGALVEEEKRLESLHAQAADEKAQKEKLENRYEQNRKKLAGQQKQREALLARIEKEKAEAQARIEELEAAARRVDETIARLERQEEKAREQADAEPPDKEQKAFSKYQGLLKMPVEGKIVSRYGKYTEPHSGAKSFKNGIEISADHGTQVRAVFDGETSFSDWISGFGRVIIVSHGNSYYTVYGHLEELFAGEGDAVKAGEVIGTVGNSGSATATPVLYFEVRHRGTPQDPLDWIEKG